MSVSGQGLLYHFDKDPLIYSDAAYKSDAEVDMDAMLTIINGVNGGKKKHVYTNGAIQVGTASCTPPAAGCLLHATSSTSCPS